MLRPSATILLVLLAPLLALPAADTAADTAAGDRMIDAYFRAETARLAENCLKEIQTLDDWKRHRARYREELFEMLGLSPRPKRTPLNPVITGRVEHEQFTVENLHFQSRPGLYVTGNLYLPRTRKGPLPAILYVCGHGRVKQDGVSFGNKVHYQHHGSWFARNGYACLTIDTLQLGEIEGIHHGTYRYGKWWWNARGYTPAGVEAWNCIRALDYLQSREEVDGRRIGVTGRSGGGAYSWSVAALDDRIKVAVPVAGITSLTNHVVDGCVEGHCDCMFTVNTHQWDYAQLAALVAPRPLLISNSDKDGIFPLDGVVSVHRQVRRIYQLHGKGQHLGLQITEGPHKDTQELRVHAFHWFNRFLKQEDPLIETTAVKFFTPSQLQVLKKGAPADQKNTRISESFTPRSTPPRVPDSTAAWDAQRRTWIDALKQKSFRGWPATPAGIDLEQGPSSAKGSLTVRSFWFTSQAGIRLPLIVIHRTGLEAAQLDLVVLNTVDEGGWNSLVAMLAGGGLEIVGGHKAKADKKSFAQTERMVKSFKWGMAYVAPRGIGPTAWGQNERRQTQVRRRFMLLGQTLDGMRTFDVVRAAGALRLVDGMDKVPLWMQGEKTMAAITMYASLFVPDVSRLDLHDLPESHRSGPIYLNVLRYLDIPQTVALAAGRARVRIYQPRAGGWEYPRRVAGALSWDKKQLVIRVLPPREEAAGPGESSR
ncbi:MAG: acetylxylan esterase [Planctomycetaceae bacterium]|nr:acetylxylan esterase [Planctomycetaceae bacterium]